MNKLKMNNLVRAYLCFLAFPAAFIYSYSQEIFQPSVKDSSEINTISFGVDKLINTYLFSGDAAFDFETSFGRILINQDYRGSAFKTSGYAFRDDQQFDFYWKLPLNELFYIAAGQNWMLSSDNKNVELNSVERIIGNAGLGISPLSDVFFDARGGMEKNTQLGVVSYGPYATINGGMSNYEVDGFRMNSALRGEYASLNTRRTNYNFDVSSSINKSYFEEGSMAVRIGYRMSNSDNFLNVFHSGINGLNIESRLRKQFWGDLDISYKILDITTNARLSFSDKYDDKSFLDYLVDAPYTGIVRNNHEFLLNFQVSANYSNNFLSQGLGIIFDSRTDEYGAVNKYNLQSPEFLPLRASQQFNDNITTSTRFFSQTVFRISRTDTASLNFSISLTQFDTPSDRNNYDADQFLFLAGIKYSRYFSDILRASLIIESQFNHQVNLKAEQSALNNWYRSIRFAPSILINSGGFQMSPTFEVLANYTVYDFEDVSPGIRSWSFRQISYRDSLVLFVANDLSLQSRIILRYYERGIFYWNSFRETPQKNNSELFAKLLLVYGLSDYISLGGGARVYSLSQKNLMGFGGEEFFNLILGPEIIFRVKFQSGNEFFFQGWYEFQNLNKKENKQEPNFTLTTKIKI